MLPPVLILGATSDIARAIAHRYAREGHPLYLGARNEAELAADKSDLELRYQVPVQTFVFDARDYESARRLYPQLDPRPELAICVFGLLYPQEEAEAEWEKARELLEVNFVGAAAWMHVLAADFAQRKQGTIVGISSVAGDRGRGSNFYYGSAKAGFSALLSGLRNRLSPHGVHVLTVKPGYVNTRMTEGLESPAILTADPERVAQDVYQAVKRKRNILYTKGLWRWIMLVIRHIPEGIFKKLKL